MMTGGAASGRSADGADPRPEARPGRIPFPQLALRVAWIAVQATLAFMLADKASPFFYQQF